MNNVPVYKLRLARTLYNNFYRARLQDANGEDAGQLLIVPGLPLDRSQLPENAPRIPGRACKIHNRDHLVQAL